MKIKILLILFSAFALSYNKLGSSNSEWENVFKKNNVKGTFVLYDINTRQYEFYNEARADSPFIPASTFKILNSLIALEENTVKDENEIIKWDGIDRGWSEWNKDQNMKSAMPVSCVWFYQELARRTGKIAMQKWLRKASYGNQLMGVKIDNFWLEGDLRISAKEQVEFIKKLVNDELSFKLKNQELVKQIMITDSTGNYTIHSKTGWAQDIGWIVGYVEKENNNWIFALNINLKNKSGLKLRRLILYDILKIEKLL